MLTGATPVPRINLPAARQLKFSFSAARRLRASLSGAALASMLLLTTHTASALDSSWATLTAPPTGTAPPGDVIRAGHLGREIENTQDIIHFYNDLIGLGLIGPRDAPRKFMVSHPLAEFAELGEGKENAYD